MQVYTAPELCAEMGIGARTLQNKVRAGEVTKLDRGCYVKGALDVREWIRALQELHPSWVLAGRSALQFHARQQITFPLHFRTERPAKSRATDKFILTSHRNHSVTRYGPFNVATPILAAWEARREVPEEGVKRFLEQQYAGKDGKQRLETELNWMPKLPDGLRDFLATFSIGADSKLERRFFAALAARGLEFEQNVLIGPYFWDFQSKKLKRLLIEIGAYEYHRDLSTEQGQASYIREAWKFNHASLHGYVVLQFTAKCIDREMERCLDMVEDTMAALRGGLRKEWKPPWKWHSWLVERARFRSFTQ